MIELTEKLIKILNKKELPKQVTPGKCYDEIVANNDLQGKHLNELPKKLVEELSWELSIFTNEAFQYYIFEYMLIYLSNAPWFETNAFILNLLADSDKEYPFRYNVGFTSEEVLIIIDFLKYCLKDIQSYEPWTDPYESNPSAFSDWKDQILLSLPIWEKHPALNERK